MRLFSLPAGAIFGIFDHDSERGQLVTDAVTPCKIPCAACLLSLCQQCINLLVAERIGGPKLRRCLVAPSLVLCPLQGGTRNLGIAIFKNAENFIEAP